MRRLSPRPLLVLVALLTLPASAPAQDKTYTNGENNAAAVDTTGDITLTVNNADTATQSGLISGTGSLTKTGAGNLSIYGTNNNAYTGGTIISAGTLSLISGSPAPLSGLGSGSILVSNGAILSSIANETAFNQAISVQGTGSTLQIAGGDKELHVGFDGSGSLSVTDGGAVTNSFSDGDIYFGGKSGTSQATVTLSGSGSTISAGKDIYLGNSSSSALASSVTVSNNATISAGRTLYINTSGTLSLSSGAIATVADLNNVGVINLNAGGTLRTGKSGYNNNDSGTGTINLAGGTLQANEVNFTTSNLATLAGGATNTIDTNGVNITWNGVISGTGGLTKAGAGTLTLAGANTYTGDTIISAGTLSFAADNATLTYGGAITGAGNFAQAGSNTVTLTGDNTYAGTTAVDAGTLVFADRGAYYDGTLDATTAGQLTVASGATAGFGVGGSGWFSESDLGTVLTHATFAAGARLGLDTTNATAGTFTLAGALTDTNSGANALGLDKLGSGNLTLGAANTYTGGTVVQAGTLTLGHAGALGSTSASLTLNGGTLDLGGFTPTVGTATFNGGTFTNGNLNNAAAYEVRTGTLAASLGGTAALTKTGTGTFILSGDNTYAGTTTVSAGTLTFADRGAYYGGTLDATTAGQLTVASGATAAFGVGDAGYFSTSDLGVIQANSSFASGSTLGIDTSNATGGTFTWDNAATGTLHLVKEGTGTLTLSGTASGSGNLTVNAGTLRFEGAAAAFPYATLDHAGTMDFAQSNEVTVTGNETGAGALTITGGGTVNIAGALLDGTGDLTISNGTLNSASGGRDIRRHVIVTGSDSTLAIGTSGLRFGGDGSLLVTNGGTVTYASTGNSSFSNLIIGSLGNASATVTGAGSTLTTASTIWLGRGGPDPAFTGTLNITDGGVVTSTHTSDSRVGNTGGNGVINLSGTGSQFNLSGLLVAGYTIDTTGTVSIGSGATLTADRLLLADDAGSTGTLNLNTGGTLIVSDANGTALSSGSGSATFNFAGGTLKSNGSNALTVSSHATLADGTTSTFDTNGQAGTFSGLLSGSGNFTKAGAGTLTLNAANTYTGDTAITAGTLALGDAGALQGSTLTTATGLSFGSLDQATLGGLSGSQNLALTNGSAAAVALTVGNNNTSTAYSGVLSGAGSLLKSGSGTLTLSGDHTYSGGTTVSAGTLQIGDGGTAGSVSGNITNNATLAFHRSDTFNHTGVISGSGAVTQAGTGTLILTADHTYTGLTTISSGTLQLGTGGSTGSLSGNVANSGTLAFNRALSQTYGGVISGTGSVVSDGGVVAFSAAQTYTGATAIKSGAYLVLATGTDQGLAAATTVDIESGGFLDISNRATTIAGLTDAGEVYSYGGGSGVLTVSVGTGQSQTFSGELGSDYPSFALTKAGSGTLTLSGTSTHTGGTTVNAGTLALGHATDTLPDTGAVTVAGGTLALGPNSDTVGAVSLSAGSVTGSGSLTGSSYSLTDSGTLSANLAGSGALAKSGAGTVTLSGNNTYTGVTTVSAGTLRLGSAGALAGTSSVDVHAGATLDLNHHSVAIGDLDGAGNIALGSATLTTGDADNHTISGVISGSGALTKVGAGFLTLTGSNTYTGATVISAGTLHLGESVPLATSAITIAAGATFRIDADSGFTLGSGQSLGGAGTVANGALTVGSGATLAPGASPGTLSASDTIFAGGGNFAFELNDATGTAGANPGWDLLSISGTLDIEATSGNPFGVALTSLTLADLAGPAANFETGANYSFTFVTTTDGITGFDAEAFALTTDGFANPFAGTWSVGLSGNSLTLDYTGASAIPEPSTYAAWAGAAALILAAARRRSATGRGTLNVQR